MSWQVLVSAYLDLVLPLSGVRVELVGSGICISTSSVGAEENTGCSILQIDTKVKLK